MCKAEGVIKKLLAQKKTVAVAESCTGGLLAAAFTDYAGISEIFMEGVVTYANAAKVRLGVKQETLTKYGAVSHETAREMAVAVRKRANTDIGLSTTGIAGPGGGTEKKPVGLVYVGISTEKETKSYALRFAGNRNDVRKKTVLTVFRILDTVFDTSKGKFFEMEK